MQIKFIVPGEPKGKARPRIVSKNGFSRAYTPQNTITYENLVKWCYSTMEGNKMLEGPLKAEITGYFQIPKSTPKKKYRDMAEGKTWHTKKCDADNLGKIILDALNGIAYKDDSSICDLHITKKYSEKPRVEVVLSELSDSTS